MAALKENAVTKLGSAVIDMKTAATTTIFTVPIGKTCVITHVIVRNPSATLAGGTSYSITNFRQAFSLNGLTATTGYFIVQGTDLTLWTVTASGVAVQLTVTTGSTGAATATVEVFGYLY
jgi:hypothetical protein